MLAAQWFSVIFRFTLLDKQRRHFKVSFIDQSGTKVRAVVRRFFADIVERCENRKLVVGRWSLNVRRWSVVAGSTAAEASVSANDQRPTTNDEHAVRPATRRVTAVSNGISQQVDVNH
ncbi:MAG: hypothetical protein ACXVZH_04760 [Terriglobales bacterium]